MSGNRDEVHQGLKASSRLMGPEPKVQNDKLSASALSGLYLKYVKQLKIMRYRVDEFNNQDFPKLTELITSIGFETVGDFSSAIENIPRDHYVKFAKFMKRVEPERLFKFVLIKTDVKKDISSLDGFGAFMIERRILDFYEEAFPELDLENIISKSNIKIRPQ